MLVSYPLSASQNGSPGELQSSVCLLQNLVKSLLLNL